MKQPKLRDARHLISELYPLGQLPQDLITRIGAGIVYLLHTGRTDLTGDDWGNIFAQAVEGTHFSSPVGIADVAKDRMAWSMKTVKSPRPLEAGNVRLISGRCSPDYSYGIEDPHENIQKTGEAVLAIWNSRVDIALSHFPQVRVNILVRSNTLDEFCLFEEYLEHYHLADFEWVENRNSNLEAINKHTGLRQFVWQPHGSQFTILTRIPENAIKFRLKRPELLTQETALQNLGFDASWIEFL